MKMLLILIAVIIGIIGLAICTTNSNERNMLRYAAQFNLSPIGAPDLKPFSLGPFWYKDDHHQVWSLEVAQKDGSPARLWVRFGIVDSVYLVTSNKEICLK
jgi:hypothetical protein